MKDSNRTNVSQNNKQQMRNYQKELDKIAEQIKSSKECAEAQGADYNIPRLLLHSCCAPCSSYVLEYLRQYFAITVFYYNPNISMEQEYQKRMQEQKRLICAYNDLMEGGYPISVIEGNYQPEEFYQIAKGLEQCPEGGERCFACYRLRLEKTAQLAQEYNQKEQLNTQNSYFAYFTTTLTISPLKNARKLNEIGEQLAQQYQVAWLPCDFKKKNGYKRSIELSAEYGLYRQDYCGCVYSKR